MQHLGLQDAIWRIFSMVFSIFENSSSWNKCGSSQFFVKIGYPRPHPCDPWCSSLSPFKLNPLEIEKTTTKTPRTSWNIQMSNPNWNSLNYQCYILANKSNTLNKHPNRNHEQQKNKFQLVLPKNRLPLKNMDSHINIPHYSKLPFGGYNAPKVIIHESNVVKSQFFIVHSSWLNARISCKNPTFSWLNPHWSSFLSTSETPTSISTISVSDPMWPIFRWHAGCLPGERQPGSEA